MKGPLFWILFQRCSAEFLKFLIFGAKWPKPEIASVPTGHVTGHLARFQPRTGWGCFRLLTSPGRGPPGMTMLRGAHPPSGPQKWSILLSDLATSVSAPCLCHVRKDFWPPLAPFCNNQPLQLVFCLLIQPWGTRFFRLLWSFTVEFSEL